MPVETVSRFATVIQEHLELKRRNAALEHEMPLEKYMPDDPFENHPLFKTEEQARVEDTMDGVQSIVDEPTSLDWPTVEDTFVDNREPTSRPTPNGRPDRGSLRREPLVALARLRLGRLDRPTRASETAPLASRRRWRVRVGRGIPWRGRCPS